MAISGILMGLLQPRAMAAGAAADSFAFTLSDAQWRERLDTAQFKVLREHGTELPNTSPLNKQYGKGRFICAGCDQALFASDTKYDSHTGWPSFWQPLAGAVGETIDNSYGMSRTEVHCSRCGGHLGHVFKDGPKPTGLRYCMNGVAMKFVPAES